VLGHQAPPLNEQDEEDLFFSSPAHHNSFTPGLTRDASSPTRKARVESVEKLPKKFRPRDSGIVVDGDDSDDDFQFRTGKAQLLAMSVPRPSGSLGSMQSESDGTDGEALVTPGFGPGPDSGWPLVGIVNPEDSFPNHDNEGANTGIDAFIMRTLVGGSKASAPIPGELQRIPGTPVKKARTTHLVERPWQSAVTSKIGFPEFDPPREGGGKDKKGKPRKSLPAAFPGFATSRQRKDALTLPLHEDDEEEASPTMRKDTKYSGIGLGRPPVPSFPKTVDSKARTHWLMRRSSSGAFSSGSETVTSRNATPTRIPAKGECIYA
jgi:mitosis inhibitor protein kinase SWE1